MFSKSIVVYDKDHKFLVNFYQYGADLKYGWTLNDIDTMEVSISLSDPKCTDGNLQFGNHVEVVENSQIIWGGVLFSRNFSDGAVKITCMDYNSVLKYLLCIGKQYSSMEYGTLMQQMIADSVNYWGSEAQKKLDYKNSIISTGVLKTDRETKTTDTVWDKIKEFGDDANYDYWVDVNRIFHFKSRRGADKPQYIFEYGGEKDNIIVAPALAQDIKSIKNEVLAQTDGDSPLTSLVKNQGSIDKYGLFLGTFSPNSGVTLQSTLDTQANGELQRNCYPADNITLTVRDSVMAQFQNLEVGDRVTLHLIPYFNYTATVRILRMVHTYSTNTREITVGSVIFKPSVVTKRLYKR